jgi:membrane protein
MYTEGGLRILWKSLGDFFRHDGPILAGSITCFFMMSIAPFFLLIVAVFGYFLGEHPEFYEFLATRLTGFFPEATAGIMEELQKIIAYQRIGLLTLAVYAYFSYQLYFSFERAVNLIFESEGKRSLFKSLLLSLFVTISLIVLFFLFFAAKIFISLLEPLAQFFPGLTVGKITTWLMGFVLPIVLMFVTTSALYKILPQEKVMIRHALLGALAMTLLFEAGKHIFTYYAMLKVAQIGMIYGSLTAVVVFLLWIFYAACIFLLGAEIVRNLDKAKRQSMPAEAG